eukprot:scaffold4216_cov389-Prasinococcus_capsulatus_cf.AAC.2
MWQKVQGATRQQGKADVLEAAATIALGSTGSGASPTWLVHPDTYLDKVLVGCEGGSMQLWNIRTGRLIYSFAVREACGAAHGRSRKLTSERSCPRSAGVGLRCVQLRGVASLRCSWPGPG